MNVKITVCLLLLLVTTVAVAQNQWELSKDKNNIKVFTSKETTSKFKTVKVEATMQGTIQKLGAVIRDVNSNTNWVYNTKQSYVIKRNGLNDILYYNRTELPWPIDDRDVVIRMKVDVDSINNALKVNATAEPNVIAEKAGLVRIKLFNSTWYAKAVGDGLIFVTYVLKTNPEGNLPASVTNMFMSKGPYETFYNLAALLKK